MIRGPRSDEHKYGETDSTIKKEPFQNSIQSRELKILIYEEIFYLGETLQNLDM